MKITKWLASFCLACSSFAAFAQDNLPTDYLGKDFHRGRREAFRTMMPENSVALIFSYPERVFSKDVNYVFHQNPDLYYLSGYKEPDAVLVLFKESQGSGDSTYNEVFFVRKRDPANELWTGRRLGVEGAKNKLGFKRVFEGREFAQSGIDFSKFSTIISDHLPTDIRSAGTGEDLAGLLNVIRPKFTAPTEDSAIHEIIQYVGQSLTFEALPKFEQYLKENPARIPEFNTDPRIRFIMNKPTAAQLDSLKLEIRKNRWGIDYFTEITNSLREIKTPEELVLMRKVAMISAIAHTEVMKAIQPQMSEREAEGIQLYVHKHYGAEDEGYPAIVGAGANSCILHYGENSSMKIDNQLLLMDVGAEYHGYSADVTRTIPANGKFSPEQKAIYQIVYDAQEAVFNLCKEGTPISDLNKKATEIIAQRLIELGIIKNKSEVTEYYPHGCSHFLGLDVHDKGNYRSTLKQNMIITVEPGIYIPPNSKCDKKWWNIGVRIEDDILIKKDSFENLSAFAPRKVEDIEKAAAQKSGFNAIDLPPLVAPKAGF